MAERELVMLNEQQYPSNSHKSKQEKKEREVVVEKVVKAGVRKKKKSFLSRFKDDVGGEDAKTIGEYILYDVFVPAMKDMIFDMVKGGVERALFGETRPRDDIDRSRGRSYVSYSSYYKDRDRGYSRSSRRDRRKTELDDLVFSSREDAERVLDRMLDMVEDYGQVSVYDMYALCDVTGDYTDQKWGWDDLRRAAVVRTREGYLLDLPKAVVL